MRHDVALQVAMVGELLAAPAHIARVGLLSGVRLHVHLQVRTGHEAPLTLGVLATEGSFTCEIRFGLVLSFLWQIEFAHIASGVSWF